MKILSVCAGFLLVLSLSACNFGSDNESFDVELRGTWVSIDKSVYSGTLKIEDDRITITGYCESQTLTDTNDNRRPFREFIREIPLKGYSRNGKIYIEDAGEIQDGIPYTYWDDNPPPENVKIEFLRFNFDGRNETLIKLPPDPEPSVD
jgi:hypothetical protein